MDTKGLAVGTSVCGSANGEVIERRLGERGEDWIGDPGDVTMGELEVALENGGGMLAVRLVAAAGEGEAS
jgi:hypothetical protein